MPVYPLVSYVTITCIDLAYVTVETASVYPGVLKGLSSYLISKSVCRARVD